MGNPDRGADTYANGYGYSDVHAYTNTDSYSHAHTYSYSHGYSNVHAYGNADGYVHAHTHSYSYSNVHAHADTDSYPHAHTYSYSYGLGYSYSHVHAYTNSYSYADIYSNSHGYGYSYVHAHANPDGDANRHLPGNLYDSYYHWHHNRGWHRHRQPLRRLHHGHHSTLRGKRIRQSAGYSGGCRVGRRHTLPRALQQTVLVARVRAGGSGDWTGSVPEYLLP